MFKKLLCLFLIFESSQARYGFVPKFYGQDSAVIVDTDKPLPQTNKMSLNYPTKLRIPPPFPIWQHFPRYHIMPPPPPPSPGQILAIKTWSKNQGKAAVITFSTTTTSSSSTTTTTPKPTTSTTRTSTTASTPYAPPPRTSHTNSKFEMDTVPFVTDDEFPKELLDIAQNKLGLKSLDEIPSISELGQLLGTKSPQETLKYIKQLTSNDQGVALMKAYIESTDYTDNTGDLDESEDYEDDEDKGGLETIGDIEEPLTINDEGLVVVADEEATDDYDTERRETNNENEELQQEKELQIKRLIGKPRKTPKILNKLKYLSAGKPGFFERIANFMHLNNLWHKKATTTKTTQKEDEDEDQTQDTTSIDISDINRVTFLGKKIEDASETLSLAKPEESATVLPILVRDPIPYNYPVPIRASTTISTTPPATTTTTTAAPQTTSVHLNTPKMLIPHVQQLAKATKISPKKIEEFLATKPKLLALANKVSRFPIGYDRNSRVEAQVLSAVQRAIEQDEDLKKLLNSTATLK